MLLLNRIFGAVWRKELQLWGDSLLKSKGINHSCCRLRHADAQMQPVIYILTYVAVAMATAYQCAKLS